MSEYTADLDLDIIGVLEGTDKSSSVAFAWDYLRHYQALFAPWRHEPINVIEIGVQNGLSLNVWRRYFSRAQIIGIDIAPECARFAGDRIAIETGSQEDPGFLHHVCAKYPPTIIIDDGSHLAHHMVYSFKHLFAMLQSGGVYVVEDMELQFGRFGSQWSGNNTVSAPDYFLELARGRMANNTPLSAAWGDDLYVREFVDTVSFFGGAVAIHKRKSRDIGPALAWAERHLLSFNASQDHFLRLAEYIVRHNGPLDEAERTVRAAVSSGGPTSLTFKWLIEILVRQGRLEEAAVSASEATRLRPDDHSTWGMLAHVERQRGRVGDAIVALEQAVSIRPQLGNYHDQLGFLLQQQGNFARALTFAINAARLNPEYEPWQRRVADLERLAAGSGA